MLKFTLFLRSEFEGDIAPYSPRFQDNWSPGTISFFNDDNPDFGHDNNEDFVLRKLSRESSRVSTYYIFTTDSVQLANIQAYN